MAPSEVSLYAVIYTVEIAIRIGRHEGCLSCHGQGCAANSRVEVSSMRQGNPQGGQACTHSLPPPQILHKISSKCSKDEMIVIQCCEVVHESKTLLPPECAVWQPPSLSIDVL